MPVRRILTKEQERDYPEILAATLNGRDRKASLEYMAGMPGDRPSLNVQGFCNPSRETRDAAVKEFLSELARLANQWISSGRLQFKEIGEQPWERNVRWFSDAYPERIDKTFLKFLQRNPPPIEPTSDGRLEIASHLWPPRLPVWPLPEPNLEDTLERARDFAIAEFQKFLESGCPQRLFKCDECSKYFALARKPRQVIQRGSYCRNCKSAGGARRVTTKRDAEKENLLGAAADEWVQWRYSHRNPDQREWVARQVGNRCNVTIQRKWVSRNLKGILKRVEEKHHA